MNRRRFVSSIAAVASGATAAGILLAGSAVASSGAVPFTDPGSFGSLTFCNQQNQPVTSGSLARYPFVWKVIASAAAPVGYRVVSSTATLEAFQPIKYVDPGDWSGAQLTGSSSYTSYAHPVVAATSADVPILNFVQAYPPHWDHLIQIRMFFAGANRAVAPTYESAVIRIRGSKWILVQGGGTSCTLGNGTSREKLLLPASDFKVKGKDASSTAKGNASPGAKASSSSSVGGTNTGTSPSGQQSGSPANAADGQSLSGLSGGAKAGIGVGILAIIAALAGGFVVLRGRRRKADAN